jgi:anaerobic magnesium-protoporphyrin IX monomethyl ester cyclase
MNGNLRPAASARRRVVLYNPNAVFFTMPLALLAIGSELDPAIYDVVVIDGRLEADPVSAVLSQLTGSVCLGVTVLTGAPISDALLISRAAKQAHPDLPVVWGGWHPSLFPRDCLAEASVDVTVQGQGEETFAEIIDRLANGLSLEGCLGCTIRLPDGRICVNPPRTMRSLDTFRAHDYGMIPVERYYELKGKRQLDYISSQGCNFRCAFCSDPFVYGRKWVGLDPLTMVIRLKELSDRYHFDDVNFQDETFFTQRDRVLAMADRIIELGMQFTWAGTMRADQGVRLPDNVWARCKQSGLRRLLVGVESGSNEMLKRIQKDVKIEQVFATAEKMVQHRIAGHFPFIVGFPNESEDSVRETLICAKRLRAMSPDFLTPIFYFKPYPGSAIVSEAVASGFKLPDTLAAWSQFDFVDGLPGPWVSRDKYRLIERFKFFQELAWKRRTRTNALLQRLARYRCGRDNYRWPVEMVLMRLGRSQPRLS